LGAITFFTAKSYIGNFFMARSLSFAAKNRGTDTYNAQIRAIDFDPDNDNYRVAYSQTNLALADTLAGQIAGASPSAATENQKATVVTLVQQSIREGRNAVALNPKRAANWENLSLIYRNLINFAQGADQWAAESLNQAVLLDPLNPRLRLELGNILVGGNNLTVAAQSYLNAVNLKSDYLPARYALAQILARLGDKENAKTQLTMIRDLVCKLENPTSSEDCRRIKADLATLETPAAKVTPQPTPTATSSGLISTPSATPKNLPKAKVTPVPVISSPSGELTN
jgi:tetratricopeptide (TPR) repeat protein